MVPDSVFARPNDRPVITWTPLSRSGSHFVPGKGASDSEGHFFYGHYYACQAMFLAGGDYWAALSLDAPW